MSTVEDRLSDALAAWAEQVPDAVPTHPGVVDLDDGRGEAAPGPGGGAPTSPDGGYLDETPGQHEPRATGRGGHRRQVAALVALAAAVGLLVAGTPAGLRALRGQPASPALRVGTLLSVFDRPYVPGDRLPASVLDGMGADFVRSRLLGVTSGATYWAAVAGDGQICLLTAAAGGGTTTDCATTRRFARHGTRGVSQQIGQFPSSPTLTSRLVPDHGPASHRSRDGDHRVLSNVYASVSSS